MMKKKKIKKDMGAKEEKRRERIVHACKKEIIGRRNLRTGIAMLIREIERGRNRCLSKLTVKFILKSQYKHAHYLCGTLR